MPAPAIRSTASRVPEHRGDVYCSPGCGFGCRRVAYERAVREADALARRMGAGWKPSVHENCGWMWMAEKGVAAIVPCLKGSAISGVYEVTGYSAVLMTAQAFAESADTPEDALGFALQHARTAERRIAADCADISA